MNRVTLDIVFNISIAGACIGLFIIYVSINNSSLLLLSLGCCLIVFWAVMYFVSKHLEQKDKKQEFEKFMEDHKNNSEKVIVYLDKFQFRSNSWMERINEGSDRSPNWVEKQFHITNISQTVTHNMKTYWLVEDLKIDPTVLKLKFEIQKETILYIGKNQKYLDLEFLQSSSTSFD